MSACVPARSTLLPADCGELALRVRGREHDGRLIRIQSPKCTIGSAKGCTLRLVAPGVAPLHCWVLRGKEGTFVRSLYGQALLNGGALGESTLAPGDKLRLGSVELEVVACNQALPAAPAEPFSLPPVDTAELERQLAAAMDKIAKLEGESRQGWQSSITAADRADQMRTALANAHQQLEDACRELAATQATMQRQTGELNDLRSELTAAHQAQDDRADMFSRVELEAIALRDEQVRCLAELAEARTALASAEGERKRLATLATEHEQQAAEQEQRGTENEQLAARTQQQAAEQQRLQAELRQLERRAAENEQRAAEQERRATEQEQRAAEQERRATEQGQRAAEQERRATENEQRAAERERQAAAEQERLQAELQQLQRRATESEQKAADQERRATEQEQRAAEQERRATENEQRAAERERRAAAEQERLQAELQQLQRRLAQRDAEISSLRADSGTQTGAMTIAIEQVGKSAAATENFQQVQSQIRCDQLTQQLADIQAEYQRNSEAWQRERAELQSRASEQTAAAEGQLADLRTKLADREQDLTLAQQRLQENTELTTRCQELQNQLQAAQGNLAAANEQLAGLASSSQDGTVPHPDEQQPRQQQQALQEQAAALDRQQSDLVAAQQQLDAERERLVAAQQTRAEQLQAREQQLQQQALDLERNLELANSRLSEAEALRTQVAAEREALNAKERSLGERPAQFTQSAAQLSAELASVSGQWQVRELEARLTESEGKGQQLAEQVESLQLRCRELEEQRREALAKAAAAFSKQAAGDPQAGQSPGSPHPRPAEECESIQVTAPFQQLHELLPQEPPAPAAPIAAEDSLGGSNQVKSAMRRLVTSGVCRDAVRHENAAPEQHVVPQADAAAEQKAEANESPVDPTAAAAASAPPEPEDSPPSAAETNSPLSDGPANDESIEDYMERLLKRVRGESAAGAGAWKQHQGAAAPLPAAGPAVADMEPSPAPAREEPAAEYLPRTTAPEGTLGLSAMRDVANAAARTAIETHIRKHTGKQAIGKLITATLIITASNILGYWAWRSHSLVAGVGAGIGAVAGLFWILVALRKIANVLRFNRQPPPFDPTAPAAGAVN